MQRVNIFVISVYRCNSGFIITPSGCQDINECLENPCHRTALCTNIVGSYRCSCEAGTVGDPVLEPGCVNPDQCGKDSNCAENLACVQGKCTDPCTLSDNQCAPNALCGVHQHQATCSCPPGHLGDPHNLNVGCFKVECLADDDCSKDKHCDSQNNKCTSKYGLHLLPKFVSYVVNDII